jgi:hypothetical protein
MQVILSKDIYGLGKGIRCLHAEKGEILNVILHNRTHYICDSSIYPEVPIAVFPNQCSEVIYDKVEEDEQAPEKYYNTYVEPEQVIEDDISNTDETQYGLLR